MSCRLISSFVYVYKACTAVWETYKRTIEGFHVTSYQANFASHPSATAMLASFFLCTCNDVDLQRALLAFPPTPSCDFVSVYIIRLYLV